MVKRLLIIFGYICFVLALVGFTVALVAYGNDYAYDFGARKIIQKGHVIIESEPSGVSVTADGKELKKRTPYQAAYNVGQHAFGLAKDGFWPWGKTLEVVAGRVALAKYVILVPKKPVTTTLDTRPALTAQAISKDHRHLAYITGGADPAVYTLDLGSKKIVKLYTPKAATEAQPAAEVLREVAWSDDASHLLIVSDIAGAPTHRLATAGSTSEPVDLTAVYGFNFTGLHFSGSTWRQLYWISPDGLRRLDVGSNSVSAVLADKVSQFWVQSDRVLYVQQTDLGRSLWSLDNGGKRQELIQALVESPSYALALGRYNGDDQLVVVPLKTGVATLYTGIFGDTPISQVLAHDVSDASFSPNAQFLAMTSPTSTYVYDLERSGLDQKTVLYAFPPVSTKLLALSWFDNFHLLSNRDGQILWSDFDGTNVVNLGSGYGSFPAYSDADDKQVILYSPTDTAVKIQQLQIR